MLKKKYNFQKQLFLKHNYRGLFFEKLLTASLAKNHQLEPAERLSFIGRPEHSGNRYFRFATFQKLTCLISLSGKVPSKGYQYARFFLNKQLNKLVCSNTLK